MATCLIMLTLASLSNIASAAITNGGFESGSLIPGWTADYTNDGSNYGYDNQAYVTNDYHYSGDYALWGYSYIVGDYSGYSDAESDWARTYVWSDSQNLSNVASVQLHLTDFQSNPYSSDYGWGWGQDVFLMLDDGTNRASVLLVENHEQTYISLFDAGKYTTSTGGDGRTWYGFDVPLSSFSGINLSNAKVGICWEAISWNSSPLTLWTGAAVDDIQLVPEPATVALLGLGALSLLRSRKRKT